MLTEQRARIFLINLRSRKLISVTIEQYSSEILIYAVKLNKRKTYKSNDTHK